MATQTASRPVLDTIHVRTTGTGAAFISGLGPHSSPSQGSQPSQRIDSSSPPTRPRVQILPPDDDDPPHYPVPRFPQSALSFHSKLSSPGESPLLHTNFPPNSADTPTNMASSWGSAGPYWAQASEEDAYGGIEDYSYSAVDEDPFAAPGHHQAYSPSYGPHSNNTPEPPKQSYQSSQPPLQPPRDDSYRISAASSRSAYSQTTLGVDHRQARGNRSTWQSDISGTTTDDAFAFRDYESPQPPRVIVTGPLTPQRSPTVEREEHDWDWNRPPNIQPDEEEEQAVKVPEQPKPQDSELPASASGKTKSLYNASNFSRPIRRALPDDGDTGRMSLATLDRPESVASSYSTSSSVWTSSQNHQADYYPSQPIPRSAPPTGSRPQYDSTYVPQSILRASSYSSESGNPAKTATTPAADKAVKRQPSIRFQDPRPPPPPPPPPPTYSIPPAPGPPTRSLSTSGRVNQPTQQQPPPMIRSHSTGSSSPRAQIIEQARSRPPPPPPAGPMGGLRPTLNGSPIPSEPYERYSYYDPESVQNATPTPPRTPNPPSPQPQLAPPRPSLNSPRPSLNSPRRTKTPELAPNEANPQTPEDYLQLGITHHLANRMVESARCFEISAKGIGSLHGRPSSSSHGHPDDEAGCGVGMLMWGLALRSGWGVEKDEKKGFKWLRRAAEHAVEDLEMAKATGSAAAALQTELVLAIYEVGQCFFHGWGIQQDKKMAVSYFLVAARLGDMDAQQELGFCYDHGKGCKKDRKEAAKWYRMAAAQGASTVGLAWIYKEKYM